MQEATETVEETQRVADTATRSAGRGSRADGRMSPHGRETPHTDEAAGRPPLGRETGREHRAADHEPPPDHEPRRTHPATGRPAPHGPDHAVVLLLPGQGAQRERMAAGLYETEPVFTAALDAFFEVAEDGLREQWLQPAPNPALDEARYAQPLLFGVGYALGRAVLARHRTPVLLGHSVGELAAACLAGVFTLGEAAGLLVARTRALAAAPTGGMLATAATPQGLAQVLGGPADGSLALGAFAEERGVAVAAVNGPRQTVLAGPASGLAEVGDRLREARVTVRPLRSDHAFHSPALDAAAGQFTEAFAGLDLRAPSLRIVSGRTARDVGAEEAARPEFWGRQPALPVLHWPALLTVLETEPALLLDASPDRSLSAPAARHPAVRSGAVGVAGLLPARGAGTGEDVTVLEAAHARVSASRAST